MIRTVDTYSTIKEYGRKQGGSVYVGLERGLETKDPTWSGGRIVERNALPGVGSVGQYRYIKLEGAIL